MRIPSPFWPGIRVAAAAGLIWCFVPACKPAQPAAPAKPIAAKTNPVAPASNNAPVAYVSVFEQLTPPKGQDPFFPNSHRRDPEPVKGVSLEKAPVASEFVLKGIVGSPSHRLALVNDNTILGVGEAESVIVPGGRVRVRCMEVGEDYVVLQVEGQTQTKRLQLSKKSL